MFWSDVYFFFPHSYIIPFRTAPTIGALSCRTTTAARVFRNKLRTVRAIGRWLWAENGVRGFGDLRETRTRGKRGILFVSGMPWTTTTTKRDPVAWRQGWRTRRRWQVNTREWKQLPPRLKTCSRPNVSARQTPPGDVGIQPSGTGWRRRWGALCCVQSWSRGLWRTTGGVQGWLVKTIVAIAIIRIS